MPLDVPTLIFVTVFVAFTTGVLLLISWLQDQSSRALAIWALANLVGAAGASLLAGRGVLSDFVSINVANAVLLLGYGLAWSGMRVFARKPEIPVAILLGPAIWVVACLIPSFENSQTARTLLASLIIATYTLAGAWELFTGRKERLVSRGPAIAWLCVHAIFYFVHAGAALAGFVRPDDHLFDSPVIALVAFETLLHLVAMSFLLIALTRERLEYQQREYAATDELTGLFSRRAFFAAGKEMLDHAETSGKSIAIFAIDVDHFKMINDCWGHSAGDAVLRQFGQRLRKALPRRAVVGRLGGEEFAVLAAGLSPEGAFALADMIRAGVRDCRFMAGNTSLEVTVSIGLALHGAGDDLENLLRRADLALYCAKRNGRDRIEVDAGSQRGVQRDSFAAAASVRDSSSAIAPGTAVA